MTSTFGTITVLGTAAPHTTPIATIRHAGRWWFTTSRRAAKAAMMRRDRVASLTLPADAGASGRVLAETMTVTGRCTLIDPADPAALLRTPAATTAALPAVARLLAEHASDVAGYLADARDLPFDWSPMGRLLVAVAVDAVEHHPRPELSADAHDAVECVVGVRTGRFPCGVAGTFDGHVVRIGPLTRPIDGSAGIAVMIDGATVDESREQSIRPSERRGILVRGRIDDQQPADDGTGDHTIMVTARSITRWSGFESTTRRFDPAA
jgi:hypothetical protein